MADSPSDTYSKHNVIAAWVFGSILLSSYLWVFVSAPAELPEFKRKQLAIFSALICGLFTFFFTGTLKVNGQIKSKWTRLGIQNGVGAAAFVLILGCGNNPDYAPVQIQQDIKEIKQDVGEIKNDTQTIVKLLQKELSVKSDQIAVLQTRLETKKPEISAKAKELAKQIPDTADDYALALKAIAEERFDEAIQLLDQAETKKEAELADIYIAKADTRYYQGSYAEAAEWYLKAGVMLYDAGQYDQAKALVQRSLAIREKALGPNHPDVAQGLNNLAELYRNQGQYGKAEPLYQRSLAILENALGKDHPNTKTVRDNLEQLQARLHN